MKQSISRSSAATAVILTVGAVLLLVSALVGNSEEISYPDTFDFRPGEYDPGVAIVVAKNEKAEMRLLGIVLRKPEYRVQTAFTIPGEDCFAALINQENWPVPDTSCSGDSRLSGSLSGAGRTAEGDTYVSVTIVVGQECFTDSELGTPFVVTAGACA